MIMTRFRSRHWQALCCTALLLAGSPAWADRPWEPLKPALSPQPYAQSPTESWTDPTFDGKNRLFIRDQATNTLRQIVNRKSQPYTPSGWSGTDGFHTITSLTRDEHGNLWALDHAPQPRLIQIDTRHDTVQSIYPLPATVLLSGSHPITIQIHDTHAYIADQGVPGFIVVDLSSHTAKRVLDHNESLIARRPITLGSTPLLTPDGRPIASDVNLLALTPDGKWLFYQPVSGPLYRVETALLTDPNYSPIEQMEGVAQWRDTPSLGGLTVAPDGALYLSDLTNHALLRFSPGRIPQILATSPSLHALTRPTIGPDGKLYVATTDIDATASSKTGQLVWKAPTTLMTVTLPALTP